DNRPKYFLLHDLVRLMRPGDQRGFIEKPRPNTLLSTSYDLDMLLCACALHKARNTAALSLADERSDLHIISVGCAVFDCCHSAPEVGGQLVVDPIAGIDATRSRAILTGVVIAEGPYTVDHRLEIRVIENDYRRLSSKLQVRALNRSRGRLQHLSARCNVPCE